MLYPSARIFLHQILSWRLYYVHMRDLFIIIGIALIAILAGITLYMYAAPHPVQQTPSEETAVNTTPQPAAVQIAGTPVSITLLKQGTDAPQDLGSGNYRIKDAAQMAALWNVLYGPNGPTPPTVDFKKMEVLAVLDGTHATGGYSVSIDAVADDGVRTVAVTHTVPGSTCQVSQGFTAPYTVVIVPRTTLSLSHIDKTVESSCR